MTASASASGSGSGSASGSASDEAGGEGGLGVGVGERGDSPPLHPYEYGAESGDTTGPAMFTGKDLAEVPPHVIHFHFNRMYERLMAERYPGGEWGLPGDGRETAQGIRLAPKVPMQVFREGEGPSAKRPVGRPPSGPAVGSKRGRSGDDATGTASPYVKNGVQRPTARRASQLDALQLFSPAVARPRPYSTTAVVSNQAMCTKNSACMRGDRHRGRCKTSATSPLRRPVSAAPVVNSEAATKCTRREGCVRPNRHRGVCSMGKPLSTLGTTSRGRGRPKVKPPPPVGTLELSPAVRRKLLPDLKNASNGVVVARNASNGVHGFDNGRSVYVAPDLEDLAVPPAHEIHGLPPSVTNVFVMGGVANPVISADRRPLRGRAPDRVNRYGGDDMRHPPVFLQDRRPRPNPSAKKGKSKMGKGKGKPRPPTAFDELVKDLGLPLS